MTPTMLRLSDPASWFKQAISRLHYDRKASNNRYNVRLGAIDRTIPDDFSN